MSTIRPAAAHTSRRRDVFQSTRNFASRDSSGAESMTPIVTKLITRITAHGCQASSIVRPGSQSFPRACRRSAPCSFISTAPIGIPNVPALATVSEAKSAA
jgi:hypothetical protein